MQSKWILLITFATYFLITVPTIETKRLRKNQLLTNNDNKKKSYRMRKTYSNEIREDAEYLRTMTFTFDCTNRPIGFYADVEHNCTVFHMCTKEHERVPHKCSRGSAFNQEYRVCDWTYNFKCNNSEMWFFLNDKLYLDSNRQKIEDRDKNSPEYEIDIK